MGSRGSSEKCTSSKTNKQTNISMQKSSEQGNCHPTVISYWKGTRGIIFLDNSFIILNFQTKLSYKLSSIKIYINLLLLNIIPWIHYIAVSFFGVKSLISYPENMMYPSNFTKLTIFSNIPESGIIIKSNTVDMHI